MDQQVVRTWKGRAAGLLMLAVVAAACGGAAQPSAAPAATSAATAAAGQATPQATPQPTAKPIKKVVWANASAGASSYVANIYVGQKLGYYAEEGLELENQSFGSNAGVLAALEQGKAEFGVGVPSFQLGVAAKDGKTNVVNFYEYTYPFKWDWAVLPDSPIKSLSELKGKKVGVQDMGVSDYQMGQNMLKIAGVDPKSVEWVVVGRGLAGGAALEKKTVDAEINIDANFSLWDAAGIKYKLLPRPAGTPQVGGLYVSSTKDFIVKNREMAVGFARAVAKGTVFCLENPKACAYLFLETYPENRPAGQGLAQQIDTIANSFSRRAKSWTSPFPGVTAFGQVTEQEWVDEIKLAELTDKLKDPKIFFTNDLIPDVNKFDIEKIKKQAREFKIPGL